MRILLVEDNAADVLVICEILKQQKFECEFVIATDGHEAIRLLERIDLDSRLAPFDVALIDLNLPKYSGHEVLSRLRQSARCSEIPALIVTSSQTENDRSRAREMGATEYFLKPINLQEYARLGEMVKCILRERRKRTDDAAPGAPGTLQ